MGIWRFTFLCLLVSLWPYIKGSPLDEYISHFEVLKYDSELVHKEHERVKRSLLANSYKNHEISIDFDSHGRSFHLRLRRDTSTISPYVQIDIPAHLSTVDTSHIYEGTLADEPSSRVWGSVREGIFEGVIDSSRDGSYYVEKAHKYFPGHNSSHSKFHSVIYHDKHVRDPFAHLHAGHPSGCGVRDDVAAWMDVVQNSALPEEEEIEDEEGCLSDDEDWDHDPEVLKYKEMANNLKMHKVPQNNKQLQEKYKNLEKQLRRDFCDKCSYKVNERHKRATPLGVGASNRGTCTLSIQTDPLLWHHVFLKEKDPDKTRDEITALISQHVKAINHIYGDVVFEDRYKHQGIRFEVQRIKIDDDSMCKMKPNGEIYKFCRTNVDVSNFLNLHSQTNHNDFCLSYVFTYRDFTGGTLGLAWVASPSGASGGICEKYKTYTENLAGFRHTEQRSLNTGIITFLNYNTRVPPKVSQLTLAHEIGHNFGSPHDYPESCKPGGLQGNFIMFSSATSGDRPNNSKFSPCSIRNITKVLDAITENKRKNCFKVSDGTFCGNKIVEEGEECDCGYDDLECEERCCYPRLISEEEKRANESAKPCSRRANVQCSPSEGPCCDRTTCRFIQGVQCHAPTECTHSSSCNGYHASCPRPEPKRDLTFCNENTKVCIFGECSGSICRAYSKNECFLTSDVVQDKKSLCEIACQTGNDTNSCRSTSELSHIFPSPVFMRPGAPCNNFQGYCDVFQKCRAVDAEGPLARLKNLLFSEDTLHSVADWITEYWYAILLLGVGFIVFMGLFIKCCAVHTPSNNPRQPPAVSITDTLRRPVNTLRRAKQRHRQHSHSRNAVQSVSVASPSRQQPPPSHHHSHFHPTHSQPGPSRPLDKDGMHDGPGLSSEQIPQRSSRAFTDDPPPPYPGNVPTPTRRGYGEGRGHYNRPKGARKLENSAV